MTQGLLQLDMSLDVEKNIMLRFCHRYWLVSLYFHINYDET